MANLNNLKRIRGRKNLANGQVLNGSEPRPVASSTGEWTWAEFLTSFTRGGNGAPIKIKLNQYLFLFFFRFFFFQNGILPKKQRNKSKANRKLKKYMGHVSHLCLTKRLSFLCLFKQLCRNTLCIHCFYTRAWYGKFQAMNSSYFRTFNSIYQWWYNTHNRDPFPGFLKKRSIFVN